MERLDFNQGWLFHKLDSNRAAKEVNLPHDAMIHEQRDPKCKNGNNTGWHPGGKYLYEKHFRVPAEYRHKIVSIEFEGVYRNAEVVLNGITVGKHVFGYTGFYVKLENLDYEGENILQVYVDNSEEPNSRWYTGSGIYREVYLHVGNKTHIEAEGVKINTVTINPAVIEVCTAANGGQIKIDILDDNGICVAAGTGTPVQITIPQANLWSGDSPYLYTARVQLIEDGEPVDVEAVRFGIRNISYSAGTGLCINGKETKLRGTCIHHDNGILGACAFREAEYRKIRILKEAGFNAIRSAHNPCSKATLDACDEYGVYVMDEAFDQWFIPKNKYDYARDFDKCHESDLRAMVEKDYNHPSVIMYSIGNEISETQQARGIELTRQMTELVRSLDPARPVTCGINLFLNGLVSKGLGVYKEDGGSMLEMVDDDQSGKMKGLAGSAFFNYLMEHLGAIKNFVSRAGFADKATRDAFAYLDICGYNYGTARYKIDGKKYPERIIVGSETYPPDIYDNWKMVMEYSHIIGDFMWVAWDYLGESGVGIWSYEKTGGVFSTFPMLLAGSGVIDITGLVTPACYFSQVAFGVDTAPHIGVRPIIHAGAKVFKSPWRNTDAVESWSWPGCEGRTAKVEVYTDDPVVYLKLNGKKVGKRTPKKGIARFEVVYEPGTLIAETYGTDGKKLGEASLNSAGSEVRLTVFSEKNELKADGQDLCYLDIRITDENGIVRILDDRRIQVTVTGAGILQGLGSANPSTEESFVTDTHTTYFGRAQAVVRSNGHAGNIGITVTAEGLKTVRLEIPAEGGEHD